jgi:CHAD domain-containing protein
MNREKNFKKLKEFKKSVKDFIKYQKHSVSDIHDLRTACRELISLLGSKEALYQKLKKVIKASNVIRDIDVFFEVYMELFPKKYLKKLDMQSIIKRTKKSRKKKLEKLHKYLQSLEIPSEILLQERAEKSVMPPQEEVKMEQEALHKYRIYIKQLLYSEKNTLAPNKKRINALGKIKDCLGSINDNYNGYERLKDFEIKPALLQRIANFTEAENVKLFKKFQILNKKYVGSAL